jgi:hypothetical protein
VWLFDCQWPGDLPVGINVRQSDSNSNSILVLCSQILRFSLFRCRLDGAFALTSDPHLPIGFTPLGRSTLLVLRQPRTLGGSLRFRTTTRLPYAD